MRLRFLGKDGLNLMNKFDYYTIFYAVDAEAGQWDKEGYYKFRAANVSDGYHTMSELYEHRHALFAALCNVLAQSKPSDKHWRVWKSKLHYDGTMYDGWFIAGITGNHGDMTYHIPLEWWDKFRVQAIEKAPEFKGYTSKDVMERLLKL